MTSDMQFTLLEFNECRHLRGAPAARVEVIIDGESGWLWMTQLDARKNMMQFGQAPALLRVLEAYRIGRMPFDEKTGTACETFPV